MAKAQDHPDQMQRYLQVCRESRELRKALHAARDQARANSPLASIDFTAPLSVAGESSAVVVRAENMAFRKVPVALDLDEKGQHRGTPMEAVRARLMETGQPRDDLEILMLYERYTRGEPLPEEFNDYPARIKSLAEERKLLEDLIVKLLDHPKYNTRRFMVVVERGHLADVVERIEPKPDHELIMSYGGEGKDFRINGNPMPVLMGEKAGAETVYLADLCSVLAAGGITVCLDCHSLHWIAWVSGPDEAGETRRVGPLRFGYPGLKQEGEEDDGDEDEEAEE